MLRHTKITPPVKGPTSWGVHCTCGWRGEGKTKTAASALHTEHRKATALKYILWRPLTTTGALYVLQVPPGNGDWMYTPNKEQALVVDHPTRTRFLQAMRDRGKKGHAIVVP